ncbi:MAG TPA: preprotein translocase subunit SecE [Thermoleophilaceae bacterium]|nr:preprotein translocase subunit SecE [Thermoleophilaceae bacterium]
MARDRQRAKQRQAERRARRLAEQGGQPSRRTADEGREPEPDAPVRGDVQQGGFLGVPGVTPGLPTGAPPEDLGRSDTVFDGEPPPTEEEALEEIEDWEVDEEDHLTEDEIDAELDHEEELAERGEDGFVVRGRRGREEVEKHRDRPRVIQFLIAVWAELQRVQWPNRQALITLTGVVLGFVLIAGGYLGLLDAIFSELIKAIL